MHPIKTSQYLFTCLLFCTNVLLAAQPDPDAPQPLDCLSRDCLLALMDDYLAALVAHDPGTLPIAANARFVENVFHKPVGEGLWRTASAPPLANFSIYIPDPIAKQVGFLGMMEEEGKPLMIAIRLKTENGLITEMEHVMARNLRDSFLENLQTVRPAINESVPFSERMPRYALIGIAYSYYDALVLDQGSLAPFADECERHENGMITARPVPSTPLEGPPDFSRMGCSGQLDTGVMGYIDDLDNRRVEVADPVTGLVLGFSHFRHAMTRKTYPIYGVPGVTERDIDFDPFDLPAAHVFKIRDGQIHEIEAMGFMMPYMSQTGWE